MQEAARGQFVQLTSEKDELNERCRILAEDVSIKRQTLVEYQGRIAELEASLLVVHSDWGNSNYQKDIAQQKLDLIEAAIERIRNLA